MTEVQSKPKPTAYTIRVTNPQKYEVPIPFQSGRSDKLQPGETIAVAVAATKLRQFTANASYQVEVIGNNSDQIAAAKQDRANRIKDARERLDSLRETLNERRAEEREITDRLTALEAEERDAEGKDRAAMMEAGRDPHTTAAGVLSSAGVRADEIKGLRFDEWGAQLHRLEADAAYNDALAVVSASDVEIHRTKITEAEVVVEKAKNDLVFVQDAREGLEAEQVRAKRDAQAARRKLASLEASGPQRVPAA